MWSFRFSKHCITFNFIHSFTQWGPNGSVDHKTHTRSPGFSFPNSSPLPLGKLCYIQQSAQAEPQTQLAAQFVGIANGLKMKSTPPNRRKRLPTKSGICRLCLPRIQYWNITKWKHAQSFNGSCLFTQKPHLPHSLSLVSSNVLCKFFFFKYCIQYILQWVLGFKHFYGITFKANVTPEFPKET